MQKSKALKCFSAYETQILYAESFSVYAESPAASRQRGFTYILKTISFGNYQSLNGTSLSFHTVPP